MMYYSQAGLVGDFSQAATAASKFGASRALTMGLTHIGPDLLGAGAGAMIGYGIDGTATGAFHGATLGMMAGASSGGFLRNRRRHSLPSQGSQNDLMGAGNSHVLSFSRM